MGFAFSSRSSSLVSFGLLINLLPWSIATAEETKDQKPSEQLTVRGTRLISEEMPVQQSSSAGNKDDASILDTPQAVSVISQTQNKEQGAKSVQEATRYTAGVAAEPFGTDIRGDYVIIRGVQAGQFRDGMQTIFSPNVTQTRFPLWGAEKIEVIKGASSPLYGQTPVGGFVNVITKIPRPEDKFQFRHEIGSYNRAQTSFDIMGAVNNEKTWSYRLVSEVRDSGSYVKHTRDDSVYLAPSLRWQPNAGSSVTLLLNYQRDDGVPTAQFVPYSNSLSDNGAGKISRKTYLGEPGFDEQVSEVRSVSLLWDQEINDVWSYHQNLRTMETETSYQQIFRNWGSDVNVATGNLDRTSYAYKSKTKSYKIDSHFRAKLDAFTLPVEFMFGADYQKGDIEAKSGFAAQSAINAFKPVYGNYTVPALSSAPSYKQDQTGLYAQSDLDLTETTQLVLGLRRDKVKTEGSSFDTVEDQADTSRVALVQELAPKTKAYLSYSESFTPNAGVDRNNKSFDSRRAKQYELGTKYQSQDLLGTVAVFQTVEKNRLVSDPLSTTFTSIAAGEVEIKGAEIEAQYSAPKGFSGQFSYTMLKSEVTESVNASDVGKRLAQTPEQMGSLWLNYTFVTDTAESWKGGIGSRFVGSTWDGADGRETPSYLLYDASLFYTKKSLELSLSGNNLFDKVYVSSCRIYGDCFYGQGRNLTATLAYKI